MKRKLHFLLLVICCFAYSSCTQEETQRQSNIDFFDAARADMYIQNIAYLLERVNNSDPFVAPFIAEYGYPLWEHADMIYEEGTTVWLIPLLHRSDKKTINSVWAFHIKDDKLSYAPIGRETIKELEPSQEAVFDVYSYNKFGVSNASGYAFISPETTRMAYLYNCRDAYTIIGDIWTYHGTVCTVETVWVDAIESFLFMDRNLSGGGVPGAGDVYAPGLGGGGSGSINTNPVGFSTAANQLITKNNNLDSSQLRKLVEAVDKMLEDCAAAAIYNYLVSNGATFNSVKINPNMAGEAGVGVTSLDLSFRNTDAIDAGTIYHEMFHLFQIKEGFYTEDAIGLMEYERTLLEDITFTVNKADKEGNIPYDAYLGRKNPWVDNKSTSEESKSYQNWLNKITKKRKSLPESISERDFTKWKEVFAKQPAYSQHDYSLPYNNKAMNKALGLIKRNCNI